MKNEITSRFWDHIDGALVINLDEREDRWSEVKEVLEGFIPAGKYERLSAVNGKSIEGYGQRPWFTGRAKDFRWAGRAGCTLSHRKALEEGLRRGWESFLILEDDLALGSLPEGFMDRLADVVFEEVTDWDLCYLGFTNPRGPASLIQQVGDKYSLCRIRGALTTHAYLVKAPLARWLLERLPSEETIWSWCAGRRIIDRWYSRNISNSHKVCCISPSLLIQAPSYSDLVGRTADDWASPEIISQIPPSKVDPSFEKIKWWLSGCWCRILNGYDLCRGIVKRLRGF